MVLRENPWIWFDEVELWYRSLGKHGRGVLALDVHSPVELFDALGDLAWPAVADSASVNVHDGDDAAGRGAVEHLIGIVEVVGGQAYLFGRDALLLGYFKDGLTRDP